MLSYLLAGLSLLSAAPYQAYVLESETNVWNVAVRDISGDGKADLFLFCCDEKSYPLRKSVAVHLADAAGGYPSEPSFRLNLDPTVSALFFCGNGRDAAGRTCRRR